MLQPSDTHHSGQDDSQARPRQSPDAGQRLQAWDQFLLQIHAYADLRSTCYAVASELRRVADCDRVIVLARRRSRLQVTAISNLDHFDVRSAIVLAAEQLATIVDTNNGPLWIDEETAGDSEEVLLVRDFVEQSHSRAIGIVPLTQRAPTYDAVHVAYPCVGVLIYERFTARPFDADERLQINELSRHAAVAVARATTIEQIPFFGWLRALAEFGLFPTARSRIRYALLSAAVIALVGCVAMWPIPFVISASGTLEPANRRDVFAPTDGVVQELKVNEGDHVDAGDVLAVLRNDELELESTRLTGELETNRRRLQTLQSARLEAVKPGATKGEPTVRLAAEEEQLKELIRGLESQQAFRKKQREQLVVRSPIAGQLLTWDVERRLRARPVRRGQRLLTVADSNDRWTIEMQIADADVGHVLKAKADSASPLTVTYRTPARPDVDQVGTLEEISDWTEVGESGRPSVKMTATIPHPEQVDARPGATTAASIHLGKRPRIYVWLRPVIEYLQMHLWF